MRKRERTAQKEEIMKKKMLVVLTGCVMALTACGAQEGAQNAGSGNENTQAQEESAAIAESTDAAENTEAQNEEGQEAAGGTVEESAEGDQAENIEYVEDMELTAENMTLKVPEEFKGKFLARIDGEAIEIYDKATVESGFPGFVFSIVTDSDNSLMAGGMYKKVGEIATADGKFITVCIGYPSEIQWDYNLGEEMPADYKKLDEALDLFVQNVSAKDGGTFIYGGGTKGEELYGYTISRYATAISENWDANRLEEEGMTPELFAMAQGGEDPAESMGYAYVDLSNDGVDELVVGVIDSSDQPSVIYDVYTVVDRLPKLVVSGSARDRYYAMQYGGIANEYSGGAMESGVDVYTILPEDGEKFLQYGLKYDAYTDEKNPWFIKYNGGDYEVMSEEDFNNRMDSTTKDYLKLDLKPVGDLIPVDFSKIDLKKYGTFTNMINDFKPGMGYANVKLGDTDVFLVSSGTFKGEDDKDNAIDASIFMYDDDGNIVYLGQVASGGTANPLAVADGMLFTGTHHTIVKTTVKDGKLITAERADEIFDNDGNASYTHSVNDGKEEQVDESVYSGLYDEYFKAEVIWFGAVH